MEPPESKIIDAEEITPSRWAGLKTRIISGAALAALFFAVLAAGGWLFTLFILIAAMLMMKEWNALTEHNNPGWHAFGLLYTAFPCASLIWLRDLRLAADADAGFKLVLTLILIVIATDTGAYFTGRKIGGPKLAPAISPGKTWTGLIGGMAAAGVAGGLCQILSPFPSTLWLAVALGMVLALVAQGGDLFESWLKRRAGVKDSGSLIPGHGGLLDRVDGIAFTAPLFAWAVYLSTPLL